MLIVLRAMPNFTGSVKCHQQSSYADRRVEKHRHWRNRSNNLHYLD